MIKWETKEYEEIFDVFSFFTEMFPDLKFF